MAGPWKRSALVLAMLNCTSVLVHGKFHAGDALSQENLGDSALQLLQTAASISSANQSSELKSHSLVKDSESAKHGHGHGHGHKKHKKHELAAKHDGASPWHRLNKVSSRKETGQCLAVWVDDMMKGIQDDYNQSTAGYITASVVLIALTILSLVCLLYGYHLVWLVVFSTAFAGGFFVVFEPMLAYTDMCNEPVIAGSIVGVIAGWMALSCFHFSFMVLGAALGSVLAFVVRQVFVAVDAAYAGASYFNAPQFIAVVVVAALIGAFVVHRLENDILAVVTSAIGAYGLEVCSRALLLQYQSYTLLEWQSLAVLVGGFFVGLVVQIKSAHK